MWGRCQKSRGHIKSNIFGLRRNSSWSGVVKSPEPRKVLLDLIKDYNQFYIPAGETTSGCLLVILQQSGQPIFNNGEKKMSIGVEPLGEMVLIELNKLRKDCKWINVA